MEYSQAKSHVRSGDIALFRPRPASLNPLSWFSNAISWYTRSPYSHVGVLAWSLTDCVNEPQLMVLEALEGHGVQAHPLHDYVHRHNVEVDLYWLNSKPWDMDPCEVVRFAWANIESPYASPRQFLRSFTHLGRYLSRKRGLSVDVSDDQWFCSELVSAALLHAGFPKGHRDMKNPAQMTPGDVSLLPCLSRQFTFEREESR